MIYTIGYSAFSFDHFKEVLLRRGIKVLVDVRSNPKSAYYAEYNRDVLPSLLKEIGLDYVFLGDALGARPSDPSVHLNGKVDFQLLEATPKFQSGLSRVCVSGESMSIALMCAEKDPATCHRSLLVSRAIARRGQVIHHIRSGGEIETQFELVDRIMREHHVEPDLFAPRQEAEDRAYSLRINIVAHHLGDVDVECE